MRTHYLRSCVQGSLRSPAIDKGGDNVIPAAGTGGVGGQNRADTVLPVLGRHGGEVPSHRGLAGGGHSIVNLDEQVGGLDSLLEGDNKAHIVRHGSGAFLRGDAPVHEVQRSLNVLADEVVVLPRTVLEEDSLVVQELVAAVITGLACQLGGVAGGVVDVQIKDVLVVVEVM